MQNMKEILRDLACAIVDHPDAITVVQEEKEQEITLTLGVHPDDMGMVIGRHGRIAKALRSVMKAVGANCGKRVNVEIKD